LADRQGGVIALAAAAYLVLSPVDLQEIGRLCHAPANWVKMRGDHRIHIDPPATASYNQVDCIIGQIKLLSKQRDATPDLGFIGNMKAN
jgi:hypothetical protein